MAEQPEVPHEILLAYTDAESHCWGRPEHGIRYADCCRKAGLGAALKLHENHMRERVAADIEAWAEGIGWYEDGGVWADAIDVARTGRRHADAIETEGGDRG